MPRQPATRGGIERPRGPFVTAALFAERVILDEERVPTVVRVVDRVTFRVPADAPPDRTFGIHLWALLAVKPGDAVGEHVLGFQLFDPDELPAGEISELPVAFLSPIEGVNAVIELRLRLQKTGLYWADLSVDHVVLTRMPLQVLVLPPDPDDQEQDA